jgi:hypothetical protein
MVSRSNVRAIALVAIGIVAGLILAVMFDRPISAQAPWSAPAPDLSPPATKADIDALRKELDQVKALALKLDQDVGAVAQQVSTIDQHVGDMSQHSITGTGHQILSIASGVAETLGAANIIHGQLCLQFHMPPGVGACN